MFDVFTHKETATDFNAAQELNFDKVSYTYKVLGRFYDAFVGSELPQCDPAVLGFATKLTNVLNEEKLYQLSERIESSAYGVNSVIDL
jgi:hypothetical protein